MIGATHVRQDEVASSTILQASQAFCCSRHVFKSTPWCGANEEVVAVDGEGEFSTVVVVIVIIMVGLLLPLLLVVVGRLLPVGWAVRTNSGTGGNCGGTGPVGVVTGTEGTRMGATEGTWACTTRPPPMIYMLVVKMMLVIASPPVQE